MKNETPVVVLAPGHLGAGLARSLGRIGVPVYGVHSDVSSPAAQSRYWHGTYSWDLTKANPRDSIGFLNSLAADLGARPVLIPIDDGSCLFVADHAKELRESYLFPDQPPGLARELSSKQGMYALCKKHNIPTAETVFPQGMADVEAYAATGTFPVMLKGIDTQALQRDTGLRMVIAQDADALRQWYQRLESPGAPNLMIQEFIPGGPDAVWMFNGYFDSNSRCLFGMTGKKLRQYPAYTGATSLGICVHNETVSEQTRRFMSAIGYRGILDIGYKYDAETGEYKLLDVNPRVGATFRLFVDSAGGDVVRMLYSDLTGAQISTGEACEGRKWVSEVFDIVSSWTYYRDGSLSPWGWLRSFGGVREGSWFAIDDPKPFFAAGGLGVRTAIRKRTVSFSWPRPMAGRKALP